MLSQRAHSVLAVQLELWVLSTTTWPHNNSIGRLRTKSGQYPTWCPISCTKVSPLSPRVWLLSRKFCTSSLCGISAQPRSDSSWIKKSLRSIRASTPVYMWMMNQSYIRREAYPVYFSWINIDEMRKRFIAVHTKVSEDSDSKSHAWPWRSSFSSRRPNIFFYR